MRTVIFSSIGFIASVLILSAMVIASASGCSGGAGSRLGSPTLGAKPPAPALDDKTVVLFDGKSWAGWRTREGKPSPWKVARNNAVIVTAAPSEVGGAAEPVHADAISAEEFGDFQLHLEFFCPVTEGKEGQAKSNSGVYIHGRYEIQVLDSYGEPPASNLCGGIYRQATPLVNASRPAGEWQTYEIVFLAPKFDTGGSGKVTQNPRITVLHNGIVIHNNVELTATTAGGIDEKMVARGPILLQDHGDAVRYRNIWARKLDAKE